jgi:hypothetical protein
MLTQFTPIVAPFDTKLAGVFRGTDDKEAQSTPKRHKRRFTVSL